MASRTFSLQKLTHPLPNGGGSSNGLEDREPPARTGGAEAPPSEPPKTGDENDEAAGSAVKLRLSSQESYSGFQTRPHLFLMWTCGGV